MGVCVQVEGLSQFRAEGGWIQGPTAPSGWSTSPPALCNRRFRVAQEALQRSCRDLHATDVPLHKGLKFSHTRVCLAKASSSLASLTSSSF